MIEPTRIYAAAAYRDEDQEAWDAFVGAAKNGVFLFERSYMEYHAERFVDASLVVRNGRRLAALLPATRDGDTVISHGGLTFGGLVLDERARIASVVAAMEQVLERLRADGVRRLVYKAVPHIYHRLPAEEDLYALHRLGAHLGRRDVSAALKPAAGAAQTKGRRWAVNRGRHADLAVQRSSDYRAFMQVAEVNLFERHGLRPVHSAEELELLASRFPENVKLFTASRHGRMLAGVVVYESACVAHAQYMASTPEGRDISALDVVVDHLLRVVYADKAWFDFGISTEDAGRTLNEGLAAYKESYGARTVLYDTYELDLAP